MKNIKTYEEYNGITFKEFYKDNKIGYTNELWFKDVRLIDIYGVGDIPNLIKFSCSSNYLTSLKGIENSIELEDFFCYGNNITSLEPIKNLKNLSYLSCGSNKITSLKPILNLTKLTFLYCQGNPIDWVDYIDKEGRTYYIKLPKSIADLTSDKFENIKEYWKFMDKNQPASVSRKFNF